MANDLEGLIGSEEKVVLKTKQHWFVLFAVTWQEVLGIIAAIAVNVLVMRADWLDNTAGEWLSYALWAVTAVLALMILWQILKWITSAFYLTTSKVVYASGVFNRHVVSTPYVKIDEVHLVNPFIGRIVGFGRLEVENAGGGRQPLAGLKYLPKPNKLYQEVTERARHQRILEGSGRDDTDGDGYVDKAVPTAAPAREREDDWTPPGSSTS